MVLFAKAADTAASYLNVFIAILLFLVMPVIITLGYKYNQRMNAAAEKQTEKADVPAEASLSDAEAPADVQTSAEEN